MHAWFDSLGVVAIQAIVAIIGASFSAWAYLDAKRDMNAAAASSRARMNAGTRPVKSNVIPHMIARAHVRRERLTTVVQLLLAVNALSSLAFPLPDLHEIFEAAEIRILVNRFIMVVVTVLLTYKSIQSRYDRHEVLEAM